MYGRTWTINEIALLGTMTDAALAAKLDRTAVSVRRKRDEQGIAAFAQPKRLTQAQLKKLGTKPDGELAEKFGVKRLAIIRARKRLGIPAFARR